MNICISASETIKNGKIKEDKNRDTEAHSHLHLHLHTSHIHTLLMNSQGLIHDIFTLTATLIDAAA